MDNDPDFKKEFRAEIDSLKRNFVLVQFLLGVLLLGGTAMQQIIGGLLVCLCIVVFVSEGKTDPEREKEKD